MASTSAWKCALPAMALVAILLLPFLNTPFTIDDPIYLSEARQVLSHPLQPQAFDIVWSTDLKLRASQILPGGILVPYLLIPTALAGYSEWAGHLTQLALLLAAVFATAVTALRLGLNGYQATVAAILTATCPAVLGMAGTVMPDIAAMLFTILGMERILAWRDSWHNPGRWHEGLAATFWLTCAALTRTHTLLVLPAAFVFLLDGTSDRKIRFWPIVLTPVAFFIASAFTADPLRESQGFLWSMIGVAGGWHVVARNVGAFLIHWVFVVPLTIPWLAMRFRHVRTASFVVAGLAAAILSFQMHWLALLVGASLLALTDILQDSIARRDRVQLALWCWLLLATPVIFYIHLPSKYLLPSVPAAAILIARLIPQVRTQTTRWLIPAVACGGAILGLLILWGIRDLARTQRNAVETLIRPHLSGDEHVWFAGHWGFQWYAELAGATPVTLEPPLPQPGDIVVVSEIDSPLFAANWHGREILQRVTYKSSSIGRIMDIDAGAGFFSNHYGYLPWMPGTGKASRFEVWRVE